MARRREAKLLVVMGVLVLALLVSGCGGDSGGDKQAYEKGMRQVGAQISKASAVVANLPSDATNEQRVATTRAQGTEITAAAELADALDPPSDARANHVRLVKALRDYGVLLGKLADASNDSAAQTKLLGQAGAIVKRLQKASNGLCAQGYKFGSKDTCGTGSDSK